jgi:hypothetical protein
MHQFCGTTASVDAAALARILDVLERTMIAIPGNVRVWLVTGHTDMRPGFRRRTLQTLAS